MAKIENTTVYPLTTPSVDDFIIGTDTSDENRTVSFSIADITATSLLQGLQSVLDTQNTATQDISLTGNITVNGDIYPTQILAGGAPGSAGQILSSTGTGIQWIAAAGAQDLQDVIAVDPNTTLGFVMDNCDIDTTGSINMSGAAQALALSNGVDMTLAVNSDITTSGNIILSGGSSVLNFGTTAEINDSTGSTGAIGSILTVDAAGTGVEWSTVIPTASMPTLQEVLATDNTAVGVGINLTATSPLILDASSSIVSSGQNTFSGNNTFSANGTTISTAGIALSGSLWDSASTGTSGQVLTSTVTGVSWADLSTIGVSSVNASSPVVSSSPATPITISPNTGGVLITQNIYAGGSNIGCVPDLGTASTFLRGDGTWVTPTGAVSSVSTGTGSPSTGASDAIKIAPTTGAVVVYSNSFAGSDKVGHVPDSSAAVQNTTFLRADGTWQVPAGGGAAAAPEWVNKYVINNTKFNAVSGSYYVNAGLSELNAGNPTAMYNTLNSASDPSVVAITNARFPNNLIQLNPGTGGCATSYPDHTLCQVAYQFYASKNSTVTWELWRVPIAGGTAAAAVAASETIVYTAGNLTTGTFTIGASNVLSANQGFVLTYRDNTGQTNEQMGMTLFFKYTATV